MATANVGSVPWSRYASLARLPEASVHLCAMSRAHHGAAGFLHHLKTFGIAIPQLRVLTSNTLHGYKVISGYQGCPSLRSLLALLLKSESLVQDVLCSGKLFGTSWWNFVTFTRTALIGGLPKSFTLPGGMFGDESLGGHVHRSAASCHCCTKSSPIHPSDQP